MKLESQFEIRLCSIVGARWLESLASLPRDAAVPSPREQLGLMFGRLIERRRREITKVSDFLRLRADELILASPSDVFASVGFAVSIVHAAASAAVIETGAEQKQAYALAALFEGKEPYNKVPPFLGAGGAYSCVGRSDAEDLAKWLAGIPRRVYEEEVADMFGQESIRVYLSGLDSLTRITESTRVHGADLCCTERASTEAVPA